MLLIEFNPAASDPKVAFNILKPEVIASRNRDSLAAGRERVWVVIGVADNLAEAKGFVASYRPLADSLKR